MIRALIFSILLASVFTSHAQEGFYPDTLRKDRLRGVAIAGAAVYTTTMSILYGAWYSGYDQGGFRTFDDQGEWLQMDKIGHSWTAYYMGRVGQETLLWSGMSRRKAAIYGGASSWIFLGTVELFDAYSEEWGFSWTDMAANTAGSALLIGQEYLWGEQRLQLKWSYLPTDYAQYRPETLGSSWNERMLKDYNGHTYWLSANARSFVKWNKLPAWLNISLGYSGEGMLGGMSNPEVNDAGEPIPPYSRYRQYFFSLDIDFTRIPTRSPLLRTLFIVVNGLKIPAPALEYDERGRWIVHGIHW